MKNRIEHWSLTCTIHDEELRKMWEKIFPGATMPIQSADPVLVNLPGLGNVKAYFLDQGALRTQVLMQVFEVLADSWGLSLDEVVLESKKGIPIFADGVTIMRQIPLNIYKEIER